MLAASSPILWYTTRASGTVALVLFTATVVLGILSTTRVATTNWPRFALTDLHRRISMIALVFLGLHIVTTVLDSFVSVNLISVVVPFTSHYKPLWVGLGAVAFDLLIAVMVTSLLRQRISARTWRGVHWLAYAMWPIAVIHSIGIGSDFRFAWMKLIVFSCIGAVALAGVWRLRAHPYRGGFRTAVPKPSGIPESDVPRPVRRSSGDRRVVHSTPARQHATDLRHVAGTSTGRSKSR